MTQKAPRSVTLKRSVTVNAVVTPQLKKYLVGEIQESQRVAERQMAEIERQASDLIADAQKNNNSSELANVGQQLTNERQQFQIAIREMADRTERIKKLTVGELYDHGVIEGFVTVQEGDNLYEKLSSTFILIEDGIVKKISNRPIQANSIDSSVQ